MQEQIALHRADLIKDLGLFGLKTLVLLNAGAILALLTFVGNIEDNDTVVFNIDLLKYAILAFAAGLVAIFFAGVVAYVSAQKHLYYGERFSGSLFWFMTSMLLPISLSVLLFLLGLFLGLSGISST